MEFLKLFQNHAEYDAFVSGNTMVKPNVSHCVSENEVHYSPNVIMTVRYNVTDASNPTQLYGYTSKDGVIINGIAMFDKAVIDGTDISIADLDAASGKTQLSVGEHTAKYTLKEPTIIGLDGDTSDPSSVKIGAVFHECRTITAVEMPDSVTSIGVNAFYECRSLTSITIGNNVTSIGEYAFYNCYGLTSITIPDSVTSIGYGAFRYCSGLTSVTIPDSVTNLDWYVFYRCSSLTNVTIGNSVTEIGMNTFYSCSSLTSVTIGNSVTNINNSAFAGCDKLTSIIIPNSVTSIGAYVFQDSYGLTSVTIGSGVTSIGKMAFNDCSLISITSLATTAPTIQNNTFLNIKTNGTLTVPSGSSGYDVWMGTGNYYLGKYNWTKVEQ